MKSTNPKDSEEQEYVYKYRYAKYQQYLEEKKRIQDLVMESCEKEE